MFIASAGVEVFSIFSAFAIHAFLASLYTCQQRRRRRRSPSAAAAAVAASTSLPLFLSRSLHVARRGGCGAKFHLSFCQIQLAFKHYLQQFARRAIENTAQRNKYRYMKNTNIY